MIQQGLLWFDDDVKRTTGDKVTRAAQRYRTKYGLFPDVCYMNPVDFGTGVVYPPAGVECAPLKSVLPHHFWIGLKKA